MKCLKQSQFGILRLLSEFTVSQSRVLLLNSVARTFVISLATLVASSAPVARAAEMHKKVEIAVTVQKKAVSLKVTAPLDTILERNQRATTDSEQAAWQKALAALKSADLVFSFPASAVCSIRLNKLETDISERTLRPADSKEAEVKAEGTGGHVVAHYEGNCDKPAKLASFETSLFAILQGAQHISLRGLRDTKRVAQDVAVHQTRRPVTLHLPDNPEQTKSTKPK